MCSGNANEETDNPFEGVVGGWWVRNVQLKEESLEQVHKRQMPLSSRPQLLLLRPLMNLMKDTQRVTSTGNER